MPPPPLAAGPLQITQPPADTTNKVTSLTYFKNYRLQNRHMLKFDSPVRLEERLILFVNKTAYGFAALPAIQQIALQHNQFYCKDITFFCAASGLFYPIFMRYPRRFIIPLFLFTVLTPEAIAESKLK